MSLPLSYKNSNANANGHELPKGLALSVIGCGKIGTAIIRCLMDACERARERNINVPFDRFFATVGKDETRLDLMSKFSSHQICFRAYCGDNDLWMDAADVIILAFKPTLVEEILSQKGVRDALAGKLVISVIPGATHQRLSNAINIFHTSNQDNKEVTLNSESLHIPNDKTPYLKRAIINIAAEYGQAITVIESPPLVNPNYVYENLTKWIFKKCGKISYIEVENFDISGVLSGASIALLSVAFDGLLDGAVSQGLKRTQAKEIFAQSLISLATVLQNGTHPSILREDLSTPKGTTIAGLISLEENRVRWAFCKAANASFERSREVDNP